MACPAAMSGGHMQLLPRANAFAAVDPRTPNDCRRVFTMAGVLKIHICAHRNVVLAGLFSLIVHQDNSNGITEPALPAT